MTRLALIFAALALVGCTDSHATAPRRCSAVHVDTLFAQGPWTDTVKPATWQVCR